MFLLKAKSKEKMAVLAGDTICRTKGRLNSNSFENVQAIKGAVS